MAQHSIRFPVDLEAELQAEADREGRSFSQVVIRRCRDLRGSEPRERPGVKADVQAAEHAPTHDELMMDRQARLNAGYRR